MVVVGRPSYRIVCCTIKGGSQVGSLIVSLVESSNHCILASSFLVLVWFSLWDLELMVILMTSSSSSKTEFTCIFYDVFGVGGFTGLIRWRVLTIFLWDFSNLLLIDISFNIVLALFSSFPTNLVSSNSESVCRSCVSFNVLKRGCCGCNFLVPLWSGSKKLHPLQFAVVPLEPFQNTKTSTTFANGLRIQQNQVCWKANDMC